MIAHCVNSEATSAKMERTLGGMTWVIPEVYQKDLAPCRIGHRPRFQPYQHQGSTEKSANQLNQSKNKRTQKTTEQQGPVVVKQSRPVSEGQPTLTRFTS